MRREFHVRFCEGLGGQFPRATRLVIAFAREEDARQVLAALPQRFERYGLRLHPEKTRLVQFERPKATDHKGTCTFDFLGFTHYWGKSRKELWVPYVETRKDRLRRSLIATEEWCRGQRHLPVKEQAEALGMRLRGHYNYFGVNGNYRSLAKYRYGVRRIWRKWLNRRSQRSRMTWSRYVALLEKHPLPVPAIRVQIWGPPP